MLGPGFPVCPILSTVASFILSIFLFILWFSYFWSLADFSYLINSKFLSFSLLEFILLTSYRKFLSTCVILHIYSSVLSYHQTYFLLYLIFILFLLFFYYILLYFFYFYSFNTNIYFDLVSWYSGFILIDFLIIHSFNTYFFI